MTALLILLVIVSVCMMLYTPNLPAEELEARYAPPPSQFLRTAQQRLHYRDTGPRDAPVIIMVHEICSSLHTWEGWAEALSKKYRVIRYDMPGFGLTGPDVNTDYTTLRTVSVLASIMDTLCIRRATLVGNALGGRVVWHFAARFPERVPKLILVAPRHPTDIKWPKLSLPVRTLLPAVLPAWLVRRYLREAWGDARRLTRETVVRYHDLMRSPGVRRGLSARSILLVMDPPEPKHHRVMAQVLVLWGEEDGVTPLRAADRIMAELPGASLEVLPGLGHMPQEEDPVASLKPVEAFLAEERALATG